MVVKHLKSLNPLFTGQAVDWEIAENAVITVNLHQGDHIKDLSPISTLKWLKQLSIKGNVPNEALDLQPLAELKLTRFEVIGHRITNLSPLKDMPLTSIGLWNWGGGADLAPLEGMPLTAINIGGSNVSRIQALRGMPLEEICFNHTQISDLSPLKGMAIRKLEIENTLVSDVTPVAGPA